MPNMDVVMPTKLDLNAKFKFRCHKGIRCFTKCCSNIEIFLMPYDILRLKNRLKISSGEFLSEYTYVKIDDKSSHPHVMLKMSDDKERKCPFVTPEGCTIYTDRPASCRYYPIGQGTLKVAGKDGPEDEEFYFFINEPHCFGFDENKSWTIESWRIDQEVHLYDDMNRDWKAIQLRRNLPGQPELDEKKQQQFYMASYDLDNFRKFIFESRFLEIFDLKEEEIEKIRTDEIALMKFGVKYIKYIMMLDQSLKIKDSVLQARAKKKD